MKQYLDKARDPFGDKLIANGSVIPLEKIGIQYEKGGNSSGQD